MSAAPDKTPETKTKRPRRKRTDTRADKLMELLGRDIGVSVAELVGEFKIEPHTARAYLSVAPRARGTKAVLRDGRYYLTPQMV